MKIDRLFCKGAGAKTTIYLGFLQALKDKGVEVSTCGGVSGGIIAVTLFMLKADLDLFNKQDFRNIYSHKIFNDKGRVKFLNTTWRLLVSLLTNKNGLTNLKPLRNNLKNLLDNAAFERLKLQNKEIICYTTNKKTGKPVKYSSKYCTLDQWIDHIVDSCTILGFNESNNIDVDGGYSTHYPLDFIDKNGKNLFLSALESSLKQRNSVLGNLISGNEVVLYNNHSQQKEDLKQIKDIYDISIIDIQPFNRSLEFSAKEMVRNFNKGKMEGYSFVNKLNKKNE